MTSGTISSLLLAFLSCAQVLAQSQQVQYNQVLNVNGDMKLNSFVFPDRSKVETFSQKQQQIIVNQQTPSIPANQVTGSTGQPFVAVSPQSMTISTNGATDLVGGQIEMAMTMQNLQGVAVQPDNAYVAMLSPDRQTWIIQETMRTVNTTDMTVRMVKRSQMDGEYMVVGRQTVETNTLVVPFGSDGSTSVGIQGTGLQENEFQDGFRMSTRATQPMTMNVDVKKGVDQGMLSALQGQSTVNDYRYSVITNLAAVTPNLNQQVTVIQMPVNAVRLQKMMQAMGVPPTGSVAIGVAQRSVLMNPGGATGSLGGAATRRGLTRDEFRKEVARQVQGGTGTINNNPVATQLLLAPTFTPIQAEAVLDQANMRIAIPVRQIDGEYILTMKIMTGSQANAEPAAPAASPAPAAASPATAAAASPAPAAAAAAPPAAASPATEAAAPAAAPPAAASPAAEAPAAAASPATASPAAAAPAAASPAAEGAKPAEASAPAAASPAAEGAKPAEASAAAPAVASGAAPAATEAAAKASQPTAPAAAGTEAAAKASLPTAAAAPAATAAAAKPETPAAVESPKGNSTEPAKPEAAKPEESKPAAAAKPERRADAGTDKYGLPKAPLGSVIMTMKEIDTMADMMTWGGQVAITKMMNDFVQVSTGASASTASSKDGTAKIAL